MGLFSLGSHKNFSVSKREVSISNFIPYLCHYNRSTILTKNLDLISVIKIDGFSFETADDDDIDIKKTGRNNIFKGIGNPKFAIWTHAIRRKHSAFPSGTFDNKFTNMLNEQWKKQHNPEHTFINEHYITIIRKNNSKTSALLDKITAMITGTGEDESMKKQLEDMYADFLEMRNRLVNGLSSYRPELLEASKGKSDYNCKILEFLGFLINVGEYQKMSVPKDNISKYINNRRLYMGSNTIEVSSPKGIRYAAVASLKEYRSSTFAGILDGFLHLSCEFIITQSFQFTDRMTSISKMQLQQRRLVQAEDVAISQVQEINQALDASMSGEFGFGMHHMTIMCLGKSQKEVDSYISEAVVEFANNGINAVRERTNMQAAFFAQLPGNFEYVVRKATINTLNLSGFAAFHNYPSGKSRGNFWGDAVTVFNTTSGTSYFFSFHVRDVGHTMIIGPTGAGKTVLLNFLAAQAQKFRPRTFMFDKDRGAEIFVRAIGGRYTVIDPAVSCGFNPLQLEDTMSNRTFLADWLRALVSSNGEEVTAEDNERIEKAIEGNFKIDKKERRLSNIAAFFGMQVPGSIASRLKMWYGDGARARIFDNPVDGIDFNSARIFGFEMGELLKDKISLPPALLYLFHRINMSLDGTPTMVILDEAWALIDNPVFAPRIKDWLKVMRKLNAFVVFATQSVEDASKSQISDTLVQQTATQIYLPNLKATEVYRRVFMLSEREFLLVKTTDPSSRFFLIKQDSSGVVARINLAGMTDVVNILSGRADTVRVLDEIIKEKGSSDPDAWLDIFLKKIR